MTRTLRTALFLAVGALLSLHSLAGESGLTKVDGTKLAAYDDPDTRVDTFRHMDRIFPVETIHKSETPFRFREAPQALNVAYEFGGVVRRLDDFLRRTVTTGLLVIEKDTIVYEGYFNGNTRESLATSMSVAKSFVSALVGIAIDEGHIESVDDPVTKYIPELNDSGYAGVPIKHLLQMSSGIAFHEEYDQEESDIWKMVGAVGAGTSIKEYAAGLKAELPSGKAFNYASIDTMILGWLVEKTTGRNPARYLEEKIWSKIGAEYDATWATDNFGNVLCFGMLNAALRDYAKFGRLYLQKGRWEDERILPKKWARRSVKPGAEYLKLQDFYGRGWDIGYQYQWWVPSGDEGEFTGIGIWGQYLYVNPAKKVIIVKTSVDEQFDTRDQETIAAFRAIAKYVTAN